MYDGDGNRVKGTVGGVTTTYIGNYYEWNGTAARKTYYAGSTRVAVLETTGDGGVTNTLREAFLHTDHLGSNSITTNASGSVLSRQSYMPYGSVRSGGTGVMPTDIGYTGQRLDAKRLGECVHAISGSAFGGLGIPICG